MARITDVRLTRLDYRLSSPSVVAYEALDSAPNVAVAIELDSGLVGWGNAAPDQHVTGETAESVEAALKQSLRPYLIGRDATRIESLWPELWARAPRQPTAIAAVDIALWDLLGKTAGMPIFRLLGSARDGIATSITLSIDEHDATVSRALEFRRAGFRRLKIKCGLDPEGDIARIRAVRSAVGDQIGICIDANQGYDVDQTLTVADALADCRIEFIEQPVPADDIDGLRELCRRSIIPVMADESVLDSRDLLVTPAPLVNLKLMKTGGITGALRCNAVAEARGIGVMLGCMDESTISIAAATHFALALNNVKYADLDGHLDIIDDLGSGNPQLNDGELSLRDAPGLGVVSSWQFPVASDFE